MCLTSLLALHPLADKILCSLHCTCRPHWSSRCCGYSSPREILTLTRRWLKCAIGSLSLLLWLSLCAGCSPLMAFIHQLFGVRPVWRCLFPRRRIPHSPRPSNCCLRGSWAHSPLRGDLAVSVLSPTCRCVRQSWSRTADSARSSTRQTCTHTSPRAWPRVCCTRARSTAGCSHRVHLTCGCIPCPESQGSPVSDLRRSNWAICSRTAGLLSGLVFFSGSSLSCVTFFSACLIPVCCFHTYPLKTGQSFQRRTWFSSKFSQRTTQKHRDNGSPLTSALLQPESKGRRHLDVVFHSLGIRLDISNPDVSNYLILLLPARPQEGAFYEPGFYLQTSSMSSPMAEWLRLAGKPGTSSVSAGMPSAVCSGPHPSDYWSDNLQRGDCTASGQTVLVLKRSPEMTYICTLQWQ